METNCATCAAADAYIWDTELCLTGARIAETAEREKTSEMLAELSRLSGVLVRLLHEAPSLRE